MPNREGVNPADRQLLEELAAVPDSEFAGTFVVPNGVQIRSLARMVLDLDRRLSAGGLEGGAVREGEAGGWAVTRKWGDGLQWLEDWEDDGSAWWDDAEAKAVRFRSWSAAKSVADQVGRHMPGCAVRSTTLAPESSAQGVRSPEDAAGWGIWADALWGAIEEWVSKGAKRWPRDEAVNRVLRDAMDAADEAARSRPSPSVPSEQRLLEALDDARRTFKGIRRETAGWRSDDSPHDLVWALRQCREKARSGEFAAASLVPPEARADRAVNPEQPSTNPAPSEGASVPLAAGVEAVGKLLNAALDAGASPLVAAPLAKEAWAALRVSPAPAQHAVEPDRTHPDAKPTTKCADCGHFRVAHSVVGMCTALTCKCMAFREPAPAPVSDALPEVSLTQMLDEMETAATGEPLCERDKGFDEGVKYTVTHVRSAIRAALRRGAEQPLNLTRMLSASEAAQREVVRRAIEWNREGGSAEASGALDDAVDTLNSILYRGAPRPDTSPEP